MHIRKYDTDYGRRALLEKTAKGFGAAGVLGPLWPMLAKAQTPDASKAYPDELKSIEAQTKGKIKAGDTLTADNVDHAKHLMDAISYRQVKEMGRKIKIIPPTSDVSKLFPHDYLEATLANRGQAVLDDEGNVRNKADGGPWVGGNPFPDCDTGLKAQANLALCWGRHNYSQYAIKDWSLEPGGDVSYQYDLVWTELNTTARTSKNKAFNDRKDLLRYNTVFFTAPNEQAGTSFLNTWHYNQAKFPELSGYIPAFKRVREYPTNQRFEPLAPGLTFFLSDAWAAGDPYLTWGNYKITYRGPFLGSINENWWGGRNDDWVPNVHGGPKGKSFFDTSKELIPEVIVVEAEPVNYPRAPIGKKKIWIDVRNCMVIAYNTLDRKNQEWRSVEPTFTQYVDGDVVYKDGDHPAWSWTSVLSHDIQAGRISRFAQSKEVTGGYKSYYSSDGREEYDKYMTGQAIRRLGA